MTAMINGAVFPPIVLESSERWMSKKIGHARRAGTISVLSESMGRRYKLF